MLKLGSTYIIVKDMRASMTFYNKLLEMQPSHQNDNRWLQYDFHGQCIALWNPEYDTVKMTSGDNLDGIYSENYISYHRGMDYKQGNKMVLNFYIDDLNKEYERLKALDIGPMTEIMFINTASPYYLFVVHDPDGNPIEITGKIK